MQRKRPAVAVRLADGIGILCSLESLSAVPADYIDLAGGPDDCAAAGADIFDTAVYGFLTAALRVTLHRQAAGMDTSFAQGVLDPCLRFRGQRRNRPTVFLVLFDMQAVGLGGGLEFHVVVAAVIAYVLNVMFQIVEMGHFM